MYKAIKYFLIIFLPSLFLVGCTNSPYKGDNIGAYFYNFFENNINGQIDLFKVEEIDERKDLFYLLLPYQYRKSIDYQSANPKIEAIHNYYKSKYELLGAPHRHIKDYPFTTLDFDSPIDFMLGLIHLDSKNSFQKELQTQMDILERSVNFTSNNSIEIWKSLEFLILKMQLFYEFGRTDEAVLATNFARHILASNKGRFIKYIPEIEYRYLMNTVEDKDTSVNLIFKKVYEILDSIDNNELYFDFVSLNISILDSLKGSHFDELFQKGMRFLELEDITPYRVDYFYKSLLFIYLDQGEINKVNEVKESIRSLHSPNECSLSKSIDYLYLAQIFAFIGDQDSVEHYLDLAYPDEKCSLVDQLRIQQYYHMQRAELNDIGGINNLDPDNLNNQLNDLKAVRKFQDKIFTDKYDLHGLHAVSENCEEQLKVYLNLDSNEKNISEIIQLFEDSKAKNLKAKKIIDAKGFNMIGYRNLDVLNAKLQELLNSVKGSLEYSNTSFKEIYFLNKEKQKLIADLFEKDEFKTENTQIDKGLEKLESLNQAHLEIIKTPNQYWYYIVYQNTFIIDSININDVEDEILQLRKNISLKEDCQKSLNKIKGFFKCEFPADVPLSVSTDGLFNQLPFSLVFENENIYKNLGILNLSRKNVQLLPKDFSIFSITNRETNRATKKVLPFRELYSGFNNCKRIHEKMNTPEKNFISGREFTKNRILKHNQTKAWHISTHAISTPSSYFDNYFITRNDDGEQENVFAYDILKIENPPEFLTFSACNVGVGESKIGAGDFSLSRPFQEIGINTIVSTLWEVEDISSSKFFDEFYQYWLANEVNVLEAFSYARNRLKEMYKDPYHWAPFVLEGNPNVYLSKD